MRVLNAQAFTVSPFAQVLLVTQEQALLTILNYFPKPRDGFHVNIWYTYPCIMGFSSYMRVIISHCRNH